MKIRLFLSPLDAPLSQIVIDRPTRMDDVFGDADVMEWFTDGGCARLNGHVIPPDRWRHVTLKPGAGAALDLVYVPAGKQTTILLASIALVALTTAITGGLGAGLIPGLFGAGSLSASALAAGVGIAGSLAINALTAPPRVGNVGAGDESRSLSQAGVSGNSLTVLDTLPVVLGKIGFSPPQLAPFYTTWDGDDVYAHAIVGCQGRCLIENVKINGLAASDFAGATIETREGTASDAARTLFTQTVIEEREGVTLTNFKTELDSTKNDLLKNQADPEESSPQWHTFRSAGAWSELVFRFIAPVGIVDTSDSVAGIVPLRMEVRKVGDTIWRRMPTIHVADQKKGSGPLRFEVRLKREKQPYGRHFSYVATEYPVFEINSRTAVDEAFEYQADDYFDPSGSPAGSPWEILHPVMTGATTSGVTFSASSTNGSDSAWKAYDATGVSTYWRPANNSVDPWIKIDFGTAKTVRSYRLEYYSTFGSVPSSRPTKWRVEASNDDATWTALDPAAVDDSELPLEVGIYQIGTPGSYRYYRWTILANNGAANNEIRIGSLECSSSDAFGIERIASASGPNGEIAPQEPGGGFGRSKYASITETGVTLYLDPASWDAGEYEVRVKRGAAFRYVDFDPFEYARAGSELNADFFEYRLSSGQYKIYQGQKNLRSDITVEAFQTIDDEVPFDSTGIALVAIKVPNAQVSSIYAEFTRYAAVHDGTIWQNEHVPTQNPAALYRQILLGSAHAKAVPGESIDEDGLVDWYATCASEGYEANAVLQGARVGEAKQMIAAAGYAAPRDADLYGVIQDKDTSAEPVRHLITAFNSKDDGTTQELPDLPDAIRAEFNDQDKSYAIDHTIVYRDGVTAATAKVFETVSYPGFTSLAKVQARAEFDLQQARLRQVRYTRRMGLDGITLRRGMLVGLSDDVIDGDKAAGWVTAVTVESGNVVSVTLDNIMPWGAAVDIELVDDIEAITDVLNPSQAMGLAIRVPGQAALLKQVSNISDSNVCTFTTPFTYAGSGLDVDLNNVGLLAVAGQWGSVMRRCKVMAVTPQGFEERLVVLADEAPGLFA